MLRSMRDLGRLVLRKGHSRPRDPDLDLCRRFSTASSQPEKEDPRVETTIDSKTGICRVSLNRPKKMNALDMAMFEAIAETASELRSDRSIRAILLSGKGRAFSAGLDVVS